MKPARIHLTYWRERQPLPQWAERIMRDLTDPKRRTSFTPRRHTIGIDAIVNANAGMRQQTSGDDPCSIVRINRPTGEELRQLLQRLGHDTQWPDRAKRARRILRRIVWAPVRF